MVVILIAGNKNSGKDYVADELLRGLDGEARKVSFADPLKDITQTVFGVDRVTLDTLKDSDGKVVITKDRGSRVVTTLTIRELLQRLGTEALRGIVSDTIWIDLLKKYINSNPQLDYVVVPDFRFNNEYYEMINDYPVVSVKVEGGDTGDSHQSENDLSNFKFDCYIDNKRKEDIDLVPLHELIEVVEDNA